MSVASKILKAAESASMVRKMFEAGMLLAAEVGPENVYDFSIGNPNVPPPAAFREALEDAVRLDGPNVHGYMPNAGYPEVRQEVADYISAEQKAPVTPDGVLMTCGAGGALNVIFKTILNPGDKILVSIPYFMEYNFYADNHGGTLETFASRRDFDLDLAALEKKLDVRTAGVLINSPNNPSGMIYGEETIKALGELLRKKSRELGRTIYLISDEPYRKIAFDGFGVPPIFPYYEDSIIATSYSKDLSLPGERIGWLAINPAAADFSNLTAGAVLCNRILGYVNAPALMQRIVGKLQGASVDISLYQEKRDRLCEGLAAMGWEFVKPRGTFYLFPKAPGGDDLRTTDVLREERILAVPGRGFGLPGYFRLAFCVSDDVIRRSMPSFQRAWDRLQNDR